MRAILNILLTVTAIAFFGKAVHGEGSKAGIAKDIGVLFEREYQLYLQAKEDEVLQAIGSGLGPRMARHLGNIIEMGPRVLPYLMDKAKGKPEGMEDSFLTLPLNVLTMKCFEPSDWPTGSSMDSRAKIRLYLRWWQASRLQTPQRFKKLHSEWKKFKRQGKESQAKDRQAQIRRLGLAALPDIMDQIMHGDKELISIVSTLTRGKVDPNATLDECVSWWQDNKEKWRIPFPNKQPVAEAGVARNVEAGSIVELDGTKSRDPDKDRLKYRWRQIIGPDVELSDPDAITPTFTAPDVDRPTTLVFELIVDDGYRVESVHPTCESGRSEPDTVTITVTPK